MHRRIQLVSKRNRNRSAEIKLPIRKKKFILNSAAGKDNFTEENERGDVPDNDMVLLQNYLPHVEYATSRGAR